MAERSIAPSDYGSTTHLPRDRSINCVAHVPLLPIATPKTGIPTAALSEE
jgi:hypothetical protein